MNPTKPVKKNEEEDALIYMAVAMEQITLDTDSEPEMEPELPIHDDNFINDLCDQIQSGMAQLVSQPPIICLSSDEENEVDINWKMKLSQSSRTSPPSASQQSNNSQGSDEPLPMAMVTEINALPSLPMEMDQPDDAPEVSQACEEPDVEEPRELVVKVEKLSKDSIDRFIRGMKNKESFGESSESEAEQRKTRNRRKKVQTNSEKVRKVLERLKDVVDTDTDSDEEPRQKKKREDARKKKPVQPKYPKKPEEEVLKDNKPQSSKNEDFELVKQPGNKILLRRKSVAVMEKATEVPKQQHEAITMFKIPKRASPTNEDHFVFHELPKPSLPIKKISQRRQTICETSTSIRNVRNPVQIIEAQPMKKRRMSVSDGKPPKQRRMSVSESRRPMERRVSTDDLTPSEKSKIREERREKLKQIAADAELEKRAREEQNKNQEARNGKQRNIATAKVKLTERNRGEFLVRLPAAPKAPAKPMNPMRPFQHPKPVPAASVISEIASFRQQFIRVAQVPAAPSAEVENCNNLDFYSKLNHLIAPSSSKSPEAPPEAVPVGFYNEAPANEAHRETNGLRSILLPPGRQRRSLKVVRFSEILEQVRLFTTEYDEEAEELFGGLVPTHQNQVEPRLNFDPRMTQPVPPPTYSTSAAPSVVPAHSNSAAPAEIPMPAHSPSTPTISGLQLMPEGNFTSSGDPTHSKQVAVVHPSVTYSRTAQEKALLYVISWDAQYLTHPKALGPTDEVKPMQASYSNVDEFRKILEPIVKLELLAQVTNHARLQPITDMDWDLVEVTDVKHFRNRTQVTVNTTLGSFKKEMLLILMAKDVTTKKESRFLGLITKVDIFSEPKVVIDTTFALEMLKEVSVLKCHCVANVRPYTKSLIALLNLQPSKLVMKMLQPLTNTLGRRFLEPLQELPIPLSPEQKQIVCRIVNELSTKVGIIAVQGDKGTGKTRVIVASILRIFQQAEADKRAKPKILVCAVSNINIDKIAVSLMDLQLPGIELLRAGNVNNECSDVSRISLYHRTMEGINASKGNKKKVQQELVKDADVVLCTVNSSSELMEFNKKFDVCFLDDATQCTEGDLLIALQLHISKLVLFGNAALRPKVMSQALRGSGYDKSLFTRFCNAFEGDSAKPVLTLTEKF